MYISLKQTFEGFKEVNEALKGTDDTMAQMKKRTKKINNSPQNTICRQKTKDRTIRNPQKNTGKEPKLSRVLNSPCSISGSIVLLRLKIKR